MNITRNSIIKLKDDREYLVSCLENIEGCFYCLLSTLKPPIQMIVAEIVNDGDKTTIHEYRGADYAYILDCLLNKQ